MTGCRRRGLAEGVAARNQRDGLLVVHRHAVERFTDVLSRRDRIRFAVRSFRIDVNQAHLHGGEGDVEVRVRRCSAGPQPSPLGTPV